MKKVIVSNYYDDLNHHDRMFINSDWEIGTNLFAPTVRLREVGLSHDIFFGTTYSIKPEQASAIVFIDYPKRTDKLLEYAIKNKIPMFLLVSESELIRPQNWVFSNHNLFKKIFTWNDDLVDNIKYFKVNFSFDMPESAPHSLIKNKKLCVMINGNKKSSHDLELYSKRLEAIRWFEENHPDDFDLFGKGWDQYLFKGARLVYSLMRFSLVKKYMTPYFPSYKGMIDNKYNVLSQYKFSICYENARDIPGYITERIFDSFFAGCVPVYWGANNVEQHIPKQCFIDKRDFRTYEDLYLYLVSISQSEYDEYINSIDTFFRSEEIYQFSSDYFAETITRTIEENVT